MQYIGNILQYIVILLVVKIWKYCNTSGCLTTYNTIAIYCSASLLHTYLQSSRILLPLYYFFTTFQEVGSSKKALHFLLLFNHLLVKCMLGLTKSKSSKMYYLYHTNTPWISKYSLQADRIRKKTAYDAKKAAKEADKLRRRQRHVQRKEGKLPLQF